MSAGKTEKKKREKSLGKVAGICGRAFRLMCRESGAYTVLVCAEWIVAACMPYWNIWFSARFLDEILGERVPERLVLYVALLLGGEFILDFVWKILGSWSGQKEYDFVQKENMIFARKVLGMDYGLLEKEEIHMLYKRVERETFNDGKNLESLRRSIPFLLSSLVEAGLSLAIIVDFLVKLGEYSVMILGFVAVAGIWVCGKCQAAASRIWEECDNIISDNCVQRDGYLNYFSQYARGKEIRIYRLGRLMIGRLLATHHFNDRALDNRYKKAIPYQCISCFAGEATNTLTYCITGVAALAGKITVGDMTLYIRSIPRFIDAVRFVWGIMVELWYNADYLERYFSFLDMPDQMPKGCLPVEKRVDGDYRIVFDHVSFRYPGSERYALKDISMELRVGEKMAVVGMNGSGKSTFVKLLCRLYDPTEGTIYMNGIDIRRYDYQEYLSLFSVVFQDFKLFSFGLGENVAVSEVYGEAPVRDALLKAGLEAFLENHGNDLTTVLYRDFDKEGVEISGGEAQKIALARAVCKGAPFVLLDEPTAALDPLAEYEIYKRFDDLVAYRTTVYISHRMSSCRFCGDIAVFHEGRIVQRGSHESLLEENEGIYRELWTAQAQYYQKA